MKLSPRGWMTTATIVLLTIVIVAAWPEIKHAWALLGQIDIWVLLLIIPVQLLSYYATGGIIFSYLRAKGDLEEMSRWTMARLALELNFVNHILPSGGAAGFSFLAWILKKHKVSVSRSTMAQLVRFVMTFASFILLLIVSMIILTFRDRIEVTTVVVGGLLVIASIGGTSFGIWLIKSNERLRRFSGWISRVTGRFIGWVTRGRKKEVIKEQTLLEFFDGLHSDYLAIRRERQILIKPFLWAAVANVLDVALLWIAFWSLGFPLDAAILFIAFGTASIIGALSVTPGGAGVYEAVMVTFLAASGVTPEVAIAGTLLARVTLLAGTIIFGYVFYQLTLNKYGKRPVIS
ncbi:MAG: lysylphosphatidylglycerol synthase transmembrane domain-containing protein [Candidatus Saccharimonadaceae bacterium]